MFLSSKERGWGFSIKDPKSKLAAGAGAGAAFSRWPALHMGLLSRALWPTAEEKGAERA